MSPEEERLRLWANGLSAMAALSVAAAYLLVFVVWEVLR